MKSLILFLLLFLCAYFSFAQDVDPSHVELNKHDLKWINPNLINQDAFTKDEIEEQIRALTEKQTQENLLVLDFIVPFNEKKLRYLGFKHPNDLDVFSKYKVTAANACELNSKLHIYQYEDFLISTEEDNKVSQENVYYALRAITILKYRYAEAFEKLIERTKTVAKSNPIEGFSYLNVNKAIWIGFNYNPVSIAANRTYLILDGYADANSTISLYRNVAIVNIHSENILGSSKFGSKAIYNETDSSKNWLKYLKEGLMESIVHEMLHNYVDYAHSALPEFNAISKLRGKDTFNYFEENMVMNTSLTYFYKKGGLAEDIKNYYYPKTFEPNLKTLQDKKLFIPYCQRIFNKELLNIKSELKMKLLD